MSRMVIRDSTRRRRWTQSLGSAVGAGIVSSGAIAATPVANADNLRLNQGVITNVDTIKKQAGCVTDLKLNLQLQAAAQRQADDMLNNHDLDGDLGTDGSTVQDRARAAGYRGKVAETVATIASLAINGIDIMGNWYYRPDYMAIMSDCGNTQIGVWSDNSFNRSVTVAVYGQPA
jgi:Cysteine-rich secretory protein family